MTDTYGAFRYTAAIFALLSFGSAADGAGLSDDVRETCLTHPRIQAAALQVKETDFGRDIAAATVLPTVNSISEIGMADDSERVNSTIQNSRIMSSEIRVEQPLYLGGRGKAQNSLAWQNANIARYQYNLTLSDVQFETISAYLSVRLSREDLEIREKSLRSLEEQAMNARRRFELGVGTKTDILQAEARIERGKARLIQSRTARRQAELQFTRVTGKTPSVELDRPNLPKMPAVLSDAYQLAENTNAQILASREGILLAQSNLKITKGERSPDIRLIGSLNAQRDTVFNGFERDEASLRVRMSIPLFAGGALSAREKQSHTALRRSQFERNDVYRNVYDRVASTWSEWEAVTATLNSTQQLADVAAEALEATKREVEAGFRPALDLLNAEDELLQAKLSVSEAQTNRILSAFAVLNEVGVLNAYGGFNCEAQTAEYKPPTFFRSKNTDYLPDQAESVLGLSEAPKRARRGPKGK